MRIAFEVVAFLLFLASSLGYEGYHMRRCRRHPETTRYGRLLVRQARWLDAVVTRDEPLLLIHTLRTLSRQAIFLGSLALLAVGGTFGLLLSTERFQALCEVTQLLGHPSHLLLQLKLLFLVAVLAYGFIAFVWGLRALLAAHLFTTGPAEEHAVLVSGLRHYFEHFQLDFRHGLRAAYYGVDLMVWLFSTELFIVATITLATSLARYDLAQQTG